MLIYNNIYFEKHLIFNLDFINLNFFKRLKKQQCLVFIYSYIYFSIINPFLPCTTMETLGSAAQWVLFIPTSLSFRPSHAAFNFGAFSVLAFGFDSFLSLILLPPLVFRPPSSELVSFDFTQSWQFYTAAQVLAGVLFYIFFLSPVQLLLLFLFSFSFLLFICLNFVLISCFLSDFAWKGNRIRITFGYFWL